MLLLLRMASLRRKRRCATRLCDCAPNHDSIVPPLGCHVIKQAGKNAAEERRMWLEGSTEDRQWMPVAGDPFMPAEKAARSGCAAVSAATGVGKTSAPALCIWRPWTCFRIRVRASQMCTRVGARFPTPCRFRSSPTRLPPRHPGTESSRGR